MHSSPRPFFQKNRLIVLWTGAIAFVLLTIFSRPQLPETSFANVVLEQLGLLLILAGIFGRLWSILYVGGRKNKQLVTTGPYSMTRNPLYFSSMLSIAGVCMLFGSVFIMLLFAVIMFCLFIYTAKREASYLQHIFGAEYDNYARNTPLFWPKFSRMKNDPEVIISTYTLASTFRDALLLVALIPLSELLDYLHSNGYLVARFIVP
ncbi:protein-S-isoprenylcysteine O-methyltransferase Ste14 [Rhizobium sp. BK313]|uniref:methyltransferase family protein n=1 Tax=Rhizobium sp. BK313 TaxID=2587081 RepID=UPI001061C1A9|nr:isoprenylcysteine carboxylmethyltransferase family protein [Rhizobium sp. BK313]MBB3454474.1 protein-S-isoprenylcysteine O-methyltransferase Ste14 [Rhizobium sp. BK313]